MIPKIFPAVGCFLYFKSNCNDVLQIEEKKQAAADVLFQYSKFVMACIGNQVRPAGLRLHLMKVIHYSRFLVSWNNLAIIIL